MNTRMITNETAQQLQILRYRLAQVADLQRQRQELTALATRATYSVEWALQMARLDSALRIARHMLAQLLKSLPRAECLRFIKAHLDGAGSRTHHTGTSARDAPGECPVYPVTSY